MLIFATCSVLLMFGTYVNTDIVFQQVVLPRRFRTTVHTSLNCNYFNPVNSVRYY